VVEKAWLITTSGYKFKFFNCIIIIPFNFQILEQGTYTQFAFDLHFSFQTLREKLFLILKSAHKCYQSFSKAMRDPISLSKFAGGNQPIGKRNTKG